MLAATVLLSCKAKRFTTQSAYMEEEYHAAAVSVTADSTVANVTLSRHIELVRPEIVLLDTANGVKATIKCRRIIAGSDGSGKVETHSATSAGSEDYLRASAASKKELKTETSPPSIWKYLLLAAAIAPLLPLLKKLLKLVAKFV